MTALSNFLKIKNQNIFTINDVRERFLCTCALFPEGEKIRPPGKQTFKTIKFKHLCMCVGIDISFKYYKSLYTYVLK